MSLLVCSDGDKRREGREEEYTAAFKSGDVLTVCVDLGKGTLRFSRYVVCPRMTSTKLYARPSHAVPARR